MNMRTAALMLFGGVILLLIIGLSASEVAADPPVTGDWTITAPESYSGEDFIVNGSLIIQSGGDLTLDNTVIRMNPTFDGEFGIVVEDGGTLRARSDSVITSYSGTRYEFRALDNSTLEVKESMVQYCGFAMGPNGSSSGIYINTDDGHVVDSVITNGYNGIAVHSSSPEIAGNVIHSNSVNGIFLINGTPTLHDNVVKWNTNGINMMVSDLGAVNSTVRNNNNYGVRAVDSNFTFHGSSIMSNYIDISAMNSTGEIWNSSLWSYDYQFDLRNDTTIDLYNTTFNDQAVGMDSNTNVINIWWFVDTTVTWQNDIPIAMANLTVEDDEGITIFQGTTDANGSVPRLLLKELQWTSGPGGSQDFATPHNFTATYKNMTDHTDVYVFETLNLQVKIYDLIPPDVDLTYPNGSLITSDPTLTLNGTTSDEGSGISLVEVWTGTSWNIATWTKINGEYNWSYDLALTGEGAHEIKISVKDLVGNSRTTGLYVTIDSTPPELEIDSPIDGAYVRDNNTVMMGSISENGTVLVDGRPAVLDQATGEWSAGLHLEEGNNSITVDAYDILGNHINRTVTITLDTKAPTLQLSSPNEDFVASSANLTVTGRTDLDATVYLNGDEIRTSDGDFATYYILSSGLNVLDFEAIDKAGNKIKKRFNITLDDEIPVITLITPEDGHVTGEPNVIVGGMTEPGATVIIGGFPAQNNEGFFKRNLTLREGENDYVIMVTDRAGNENNLVITITFDSEPPLLEVTYPKNKFETPEDKIELRGTVEDAATLTINGDHVDLSALEDNQWRYEVDLAVGGNPMIIYAEDEVGNSVQEQIRVIRKDTEGGGGEDDDRPLMERIFDFNDPIGLFFLLAIILVIVAAIIGVAMAMKTPSEPRPSRSRERRPPGDKDRDRSDRRRRRPDRERGEPRDRRPPPRRRPERRPSPRKEYPTRPRRSAPTYTSPILEDTGEATQTDYTGAGYGYTGAEEEATFEAAEPETPVYAPAAGAETEEEETYAEPAEAYSEEPAAEEETWEEEPAAEEMEEPVEEPAAEEMEEPVEETEAEEMEEPVEETEADIEEEEDIPEIEEEEPEEEEDLEDSIKSILTTLDEDEEEGADIVPMTLPVEPEEEEQTEEDILAEIACPNCGQDIKSTWTTCPFCDYRLRGEPEDVVEEEGEPEKDVEGTSEEDGAPEEEPPEDEEGRPEEEEPSEDEEGRPEEEEPSEDEEGRPEEETEPEREEEKEPLEAKAGEAEMEVEEDEEPETPLDKMDVEPEGTEGDEEEGAKEPDGKAAESEVPVDEQEEEDLETSEIEDEEPEGEADTGEEPTGEEGEKDEKNLDNILKKLKLG